MNFIKWSIIIFFSPLTILSVLIGFLSNLVYNSFGCGTDLFTDLSNWINE